MIARVRSVGHQGFRTKATGNVSSRVEICVGREAGAGSVESVGPIHGGEVHARGRDVTGVRFQQAEVVFNACRPGADVAVAKIAVDDSDGEYLNFVAGIDRGKIVLEPLQINLRVCRNLGRIPVGKQRRAGDRENFGQSQRNGGVVKRNGSIGQRGDDGLKYEWKAAGDEIVLPQIGKNRGDGAAGVDGCVIGQGVVHRKTRPPAVPIHRIDGLRIVDENLWSAGRQKRDRLAAGIHRVGDAGAMLRLP